jgi:hypothetical protein
VLGPGLITGASDDDPSGIATYSQGGAQFGYGRAWTLVFSYPLMAAIQEISARIVTGFGIAGIPDVAVGWHRPAAAVRQSDQPWRRSRSPIGHGRIHFAAAGDGLATATMTATVVAMVASWLK